MAYKVYPEKYENKMNGPLTLLFKISRTLGVAPVEFTARGLKISRSYILYSRVVIFILYTEDHKKTIRAIAQIYEDICKDEQDLNRVFGSLLIVVLFSLLLYLIITPYYIITYLHYSIDQAATILFQTAWLSFHAFNLLLITEPCHFMQLEVYRTRVIVSKLLHRSCFFSDSLYEDLRVFSQVLLINKFNYAPIGMCVLERPLITKILGAVTTYLVILVQFRAGNKDW
ncbi:unnamed protein product [Colias eurytheme]|nr:unnamed protein product [Colias eurytheme]